MNTITQGMGAMSVSGQITPRGQGTRPQNLQPQRPRPGNTGRGAVGKKLNFGYQGDQPGGKRRKRKRKSRKRKKSYKGGKRRRKKSRKRRRKGGLGGAACYGPRDCTGVSAQKSKSHCLSHGYNPKATHQTDCKWGAPPVTASMMAPVGPACADDMTYVFSGNKKGTPLCQNIKNRKAKMAAEKNPTKKAQMKAVIDKQCNKMGYVYCKKTCGVCPSKATGDASARLTTLAMPAAEPLPRGPQRPNAAMIKMKSKGHAYHKKHTGDKSSKLTKLAMPMEEELPLPVAPNYLKHPDDRCRNLKGAVSARCGIRHSKGECEIKEKRRPGDTNRKKWRKSCKWTGDKKGGRKSRKKKRRKSRKKKRRKGRKKSRRRK